MTPIAIRHNGKLLHTGLPTEVLRSGDTILLSVRREQLAQLLQNQLTPINQPGVARGRIKKRSVTIIVLVVLAAAAGLAPISVVAVLGCLAMVLSGCLSAEQAYRSVEWPIIILLAAMLGLGEAMEKSGAIHLISSGLTSLATGPTATLGVIYLCALALTSVLSNAATAVLLAPVAVELAGRCGLEPTSALITLAVASSSCFLTPIGYQTNTMIYGPGHYRFSDFVKVGLPLNLLLGLLTVLYFRPPS